MTRDDDLDQILRTLQASPQSEAGWNRLYNAVWPYLIATALRSLGMAHASSAADVAQETFLQLARAPVFARFQDGKRLRGYLATVTRSRAYDLLRREGRITPSDSVAHLAEIAIQAEAADAYETSTLLRDIQGILSVSDRDLLDRVLLGYSSRELAEHLEISEVAARVRLHRLRAKIEEYLSGREA